MATKIEVYDPNNPEKPLARITVPGEVAREQIQKEIRIGVTLRIDLGDRVKRKSFAIKIYDERLRRELENYINSLIVRLTAITSNEESRGELRLGDIRTI